MGFSQGDFIPSEKLVFLIQKYFFSRKITHADLKENNLLKKKWNCQGFFVYNIFVEKRLQVQTIVSFVYKE